MLITSITYMITKASIGHEGSGLALQVLKSQWSRFACYNKMRSMVELGKRSGLLGRVQLASRLSFSFCKHSHNNSHRVEAYQDWEYCKLITGELKGARVSAAVSLLFQSYLNEKILDIQIYNSVLEALQEASMDCSYSEMVYLLYREHFPAHRLLLNSMARLTAASNEHLLTLLKQDYQKINQPFPTPKKSRREARPTAASREGEPEHRKETTKQHAKEQGRSSDSIKPISINLKQLGAEGELGGEKQRFEEKVKLRLSGEMTQALEQLYSGTSFSKINLFDVQIEINQPERQLETDQEFEYEEHEEHEDSLEEGHGLGLFELDISKIKIGRVELVCSPPGKPADL